DAGSYLGLADLVYSAFAQLAQDSPAKGDVLDQPAFNTDDAFLRGFQPERPFHAAVHLGLMVLRRKFRIGTKSEAQQPIFASGKFEDQGHGQRSYHPDPPLPFRLLVL